MSDNTAVRQIKVGRIVGLSAYEIAVKQGTFSGTEEDFAKMLVSSANQDEINNIKKSIDDLKQSVDSNTKQQLTELNNSILQLQQKIDELNKRLPDNISISTNSNKDDIIFNVN